MQAPLSPTSAVALARAVLGRAAPFAELPAAVLDALVAGGTLRSWGPGEVVVAEGSPAVGPELLMLGWLDRRMTVPNARAPVLGLCGPGAVLCLTSLVDPHERGRAVVAREPAQTLLLDPALVQELALPHPAFAAGLTRVLARRLRAANDELAEAVALPARARLARRLLREAACWGLWRAGMLELPMRLSQADLAQMLGLSRQQVNLEMRGFARAGWVEVGRESVRLIDPQAMLQAYGQALPGAQPVTLPPRPTAALAGGVTT